MTQQTNGDFLADMLRTEVAMQQPKGHIPLGVGLFLAVSALSPIGWLPWAVAGLVGMDAGRRLRKNRQVVEQSYTNPLVLYERIGQQDQAVVQQFSEAFPLAAPLGQKKPQPLPQARKQQLPREGTAGEREQAQPVAQTASPTPTQRPSDGTNPQGDGPTSEPPLQWRDGEHFVMIGLSGSSKTTTLLNCVPNDSLVVYVTLKSEDKAPKEWKAYRLRKFADLSFLVQLENLCAMIRGLVQSGTTHRLIIDEALTILEQGGDALKTVTDKEDKATYGAVVAEFEGLLKMYIRTGRSDGHWLGMVTQSPNGTDLFKSAKTMQGLKTVLCAGEASSNKFDFLPDWAKQKFGQFVTDSDDKFFRNLRTGYWHFWVENGKVQRRQTPRNTRQLFDIQMLSRFEPLHSPKVESKLYGEDLGWSQHELHKDPVVQEIMLMLNRGPMLVSSFTQGQIYQQLRSLETDLETLDFDGPIKHWIEPMLGFKMVQINGPVLSGESILSRR